MRKKHISKSRSREELKSTKPRSTTSSGTLDSRFLSTSDEGAKYLNLDPDEADIEDEYTKMIKASAKKKTSLHQNPKNASKNRYPNVLPTEETRVRLEPEDDEDDDYINANYINKQVQHQGPRQIYICCQAPLKHTVNDFWKMIWQDKSPVIVMLTNLKEKNRIKADQYWPETEPGTYGNIVVSMEVQKTHTGFITRKFKLHHKKKNEDRWVWHLHYTEWPDFGAPKSTDEMGELLKELDIRKGNLDEPIVVHCSAGIGRTGTFLAIHMTLQQLNSSKLPPDADINVLDTVLMLRKQRSGMIQSKEQYKFVYATVRDVLAQRLGKKEDKSNWGRRSDEAGSRARTGSQKKVTVGEFKRTDLLHSLQDIQLKMSDSDSDDEIIDYSDDSDPPRWSAGSYSDDSYEQAKTPQITLSHHSSSDMSE